MENSLNFFLTWNNNKKKAYLNLLYELHIKTHNSYLYEYDLSSRSIACFLWLQVSLFLFEKFSLLLILYIQYFQIFGTSIRKGVCQGSPGSGFLNNETRISSRIDLSSCWKVLFGTIGKTNFGTTNFACFLLVQTILFLQENNKILDEIHVSLFDCFKIRSLHGIRHEKTW